jgi:tetraacyldisaccharide 4'-kinase
MQRWLTDLWYRDSPRPSLLQPVSWLYAQVLRLRHRLYTHGWLTARSAGKPVIVVGNLTVGGTGKTPLVAWLAGQLSGNGLKVGIVSRGYGRAGRTSQVVHAESSWRDVGDEPWLLHGLTGCDTVVARDRLAGARELVLRGADVIIADDGLQHLRLARNFEVVVIDGARGFGNGRLMPAGPLREPVNRLHSADLIVVNGPLEHASLVRGQYRLARPALRMTLHGTVAHRLDGQDKPRPVESFRGQRVHAVAGIGNPDRFFRELRSHGIQPLEHPFADHHPFVAADLDFPEKLPILMTQKDAVRCRSLADHRMWYLPVVAQFSDGGARELLDQVGRKLKRSLNTRG